MTRSQLSPLLAACLLATGSVNGFSETPDSWFYCDVGVVSPQGSVDHSDTGMTISAGSSGLGERQDSVGYYCRAFSGDGELVAELTSAQAGAAGGIMFRESLSADSKFVALVRDAAGIPVLLSRPAETHLGSAEPPPKSKYLKLERRGDTFSAYQSADACTWTLVGKCVLNMAPSLYAGTCAQGTVLVSGLEARELPLKGLVLWLRGDRIAEGNENKPIAIWKDQSGSGNDATQELADARPVSIADDESGREVVRFDGKAFLYLKGNLQSMVSAECVVVFKLRPSPGETMGLWNLSGSAAGAAYSAASKMVTDDFGSTAAGSFSCDLHSGAGYQIYNAASSPDGWQARLNGDLLYQTVRSAPGFSAKAGIGADRQMHRLKGDIAEILVYDHVLTDSERAQIHNNILKAGFHAEPLETAAEDSFSECSASTVVASSGTSSSIATTPSAVPVPSPSLAKTPTGASKRQIFVNNQCGDDRFDGLLPSANNSRQGPKRTLDAALASLPPEGGELVVQGTGVVYELGPSTYKPGATGGSQRPITMITVGIVTVKQRQ